MKHRLIRAVAALAIALGAVAVPSGAAPVHAGSRVCTGWTSTVVPPTTIRVYNTARKRTEVVPFKIYVEKVIASEWGPRTAVAALRAGAIAIKQYAWYFAMHWRGKSDPKGHCYDVTDSSGDQVYRASRAPSAEQRAAVNATWWVSLRKGDTFFMTGYRPGTGRCLAHLDGWHLYQRDAVACAHQPYRDTTETILRRFYSRLSIVTPGTNDATGDRRGDALLSITDPTTGEIAVRTLTADRTYAAAVGKRTTPVVATTSATSAVLGRAAADVTGDGLVDIVELIQDGSGATLRVMAASPAGTASPGFAKATTWWSSASDPNTTNVDPISLRLAVGDFTADGVADAGLVVTTADQTVFLVAPSAAGGSRPEARFAATARRLVIAEDLTGARFASGDFSGDGRADLAILSPVTDASGNQSQTETRVAVTQTNLRLAAPVRWVLDSVPLSQVRIVVADLGRTGRDDLVLAAPVAGADPSVPAATRFRVYRSKGVAFTRSWWGAADASVPFEATRFSVADWNGDGRGDVLAFVDLGTSDGVPRGTAVHRYTSSGTGFTRADLLRDASLIWANFTAQ
jgi:hypothetical protein